MSLETRYNSLKATLVEAGNSSGQLADPAALLKAISSASDALQEALESENLVPSEVAGIAVPPLYAAIGAGICLNWGLHQTLVASEKRDSSEPLPQPKAHLLVDIWGRLLSTEALYFQTYNSLAGNSDSRQLKSCLVSLLRSVDQDRELLVVPLGAVLGYARIAGAIDFGRELLSGLEITADGNEVKEYLGQL